MTGAGTCACGRALDEHDRHVRYTWPDPVLDGGVDVGDDRLWLSHDTPDSSVLMEVQDVAPFVRALLPVRLTGGYTVTFGVWVAIAPDDLRRTWRVWLEPEYADLRLEGYLGNSVGPWDLVGRRVDLAVDDPGVLPGCVSSPDPVLASVLDEQWEHTAVLQTLPR